MFSGTKLVDSFVDLQDTPFDPLVASQTSIVVGISVSPMSMFRTDKYGCLLLSILCRHKASSVILIVDKLSEHNEIAFSSRSPAAATRFARKYGNEIFNVLTKARKNLHHRYQKKIQLCRWSQASTSTFYQAVSDVVKHHYYILKNKAFVNIVNQFAKFYFAMRAKEKTLTKKRFMHIVKYILGEVPILLTGLVFQDVYYPLVMYPNSHQQVNCAFKLDPSCPSLLQLIQAFHNGRLKILRNDILKVTHNKCAIPGIIAIPLD